MSSTRGFKLPRDEYLTPRRLVKAAIIKLHRSYPEFKPLTCLEPGCSWASHLDYAQDTFSTLIYTVGVDVLDQPTHPSHEFMCHDFTTWQTEDKFDLIVTNPPFGLAEEFFLKSKNLLTPTGIAMLFQRIGFFASKKRRHNLWGEINLKQVWICTTRPAMIGQPSADSCEYAYYVFDANLPEGKVRLDWLDW